MLNKITNWTFGGFFRTIGRSIAFLVIGILIALLLNKSGVKITDLFGIDKVNAATLTSWTTNQVKLNVCGPSECEDTSNYSGNHTFSGTDLNLPVHFIQWRLKYSGGLSTDNAYTFSFGYKPTPDAIAVKTQPYFKKAGDVPNEEISCNDYTSDGYYMWKCTFSPAENYSSDEYLYIRIVFYDSYLTSLVSKMTGFEITKGVGTIVQEQTNLINNTIEDSSQTIVNNITNNFDDLKQFIKDNKNKICRYYDKNSVFDDGAYLNQAGNVIHEDWAYYYGVTDYLKVGEGQVTIISVLSDSNAYMCFYDVNKTPISCTPNRDYTVNSLITFPANTVYGRFTINKTANKPTYQFCLDSDIAMTDEIQELKETLTDDDTDDDTNDMGDFLNDYEFSNDGVLTQLFSLPIDFLDGVFIQNSTDDLCRTFRGQNICLPNGKIVWNTFRHCNPNVSVCDSNSSTNDFKSFFSLLVGGYLYYKMLRSFIFTSEKAIDPNTDKVEVMKL